MELSWSVDHADGVSFVTVQVTNETAVDQRVRVENRLDGPVLPPRRAGVPESGWDAEGYEAVVAAGETASIGYACPTGVDSDADADTVTDDPPVELVSAERPDSEAEVSETSTVEHALRECGTARPPRDAVGRVSIDSGNGNRRDEASDRNDEESDSGADNGWSTNDNRTDVRAGVTETAGATEADEIPEAVEVWFAEVRECVEHAESLTDASVGEATTVLAERGGLAAVERLPSRLDGDAATLRAVADRAERLAERAESTDVPLDALGKLA